MTAEHEEAAVNPGSQARLHWAEHLLLWIPPVLGPFLLSGYYFIFSRAEKAGPLFIKSLVITGLHLLLWNFLAPFPSERIGPKAKDAETKQNLHSIQLALERYSVDNGGQYPPQIDELMRQRFMAEFPHNPFADSSAPAATPMRPLPFGKAASAGDFTYIPVLTRGEVHDYWLLLYARERLRGIDVDGDGEGDRVLLVLGSDGQSSHHDPPGYDAEELARVLQGQRRK